MAESIKRRDRANYYIPPPFIEEDPFPVWRYHWWSMASYWMDYFGGIPEAYESDRILTRDMLPGQPGRPSTCVCYRPTGVQPAPAGWRRTPGYMTITTMEPGFYRVGIVVPFVEQVRRERVLSRSGCVAKLFPDGPPSRAPALPSTPPSTVTVVSMRQWRKARLSAIDLNG